MLKVIDYFDSKIRRAFSDAAFQYDMLASLQKEIGRELAKKVINNDQCDARPTCRSAAA